MSTSTTTPATVDEGAVELVGPPTPPWLHLDGLDELRRDGSALYHRLRALTVDLVDALDEHRHLRARYDELVAEVEAPLADLDEFGLGDEPAMWKLLHYYAGLTHMDELLGLAGYLVEGVEGDRLYIDNARFIKMRADTIGIGLPVWLIDIIEQGTDATLTVVPQRSANSTGQLIVGAAGTA